MKRSTRWLALFVLFVSSVAPAAVKLPPLFGDHMLLQRGIENPVWGSADAGEKVTATIAGKSVSATAGADGQWMLKLPALNTGDADALTITGGDGKAITIKDVLIGDVWIASGQSNMDWQLRNAFDGAKEVQAANRPRIRLFAEERVTATQPTRTVKGKWEVCTPDTARNFSAVGYFFARKISEDMDVPVGVIQCAWGGMPAESFTSRAPLVADPVLKPMVDAVDESAKTYRERKAKYEKDLKAWQDEHFARDPGNKGVEKGWARPDFDDSGWKTLNAPAKWESLGMAIDGAVWFRKTVEIPTEWAGKELLLSLGILDDFDTTYFNGQQVGAVGSDNVVAWAVERRYKIAPELVKPAKATIAARIFDQWGEGGFNPPADALSLSLAGDASKSIPLSGEWRMQVESGVPQPTKPAIPPGAPFSAASPQAASALFNGMIHPLIPYGIKGAIWYQGESNAGRAEQYRKLFPTMIADWRDHWKQEDFPFLFVQLANFSNFKPRPEQPAESMWAELREAQSLTLKNSPNTGMAVTIDIGESNDIHPKNKQDVGLRLALAAEAIAYGKDVQWQGPTYDAMLVQGDAIRLSFKHAKGLRAEGGKPKGFAIAGEDRRFVWADATIEGEQIVVRAKGVEKPAAVRYAWADDPEANLFNGAGLPASPFRTDDWEGMTGGRLSPMPRK